MSLANGAGPLTWNGRALPIAQLLLQCRKDDAAGKLQSRAFLVHIAKGSEASIGLQR